MIVIHNCCLFLWLGHLMGSTGFSPLWASLWNGRNSLCFYSFVRFDFKWPFFPFSAEWMRLFCSLKLLIGIFPPSHYCLISILTSSHFVISNKQFNALCCEKDAVLICTFFSSKPPHLCALKAGTRHLCLWMLQKRITGTPAARTPWTLIQRMKQGRSWWAWAQVLSWPYS